MYGCIDQFKGTKAHLVSDTPTHGTHLLLDMTVHICAQVFPVEQQHICAHTHTHTHTTQYSLYMKLP